VDDSLNIVGVIDWEFAQTTSKQFAFCAPLFAFEVAAFYEGRNDLAQDEALLADCLDAAGSPDLAGCVRYGYVYNRLMFCLEENVRNEETYRPLFWGLRKAMGMAECDDARDDWEAWKAKARFAYVQDERFKTLQRRLQTREGPRNVCVGKKINLTEPRGPPM